MLKVKTNFDRIADEQLCVLASTIISAMEENAVFENIVPTPAQLQVLADDFREKQEVSLRGGSVLDNRQKRVSRTNLCRALRTLGNNVNDIANGDLIILSSSAMIMHEPAVDPDYPRIAGWMKLKDGKLSAQALLSFESQKNVTIYEVQVGEMEEGQTTIQWRDTLMSKSSRNVLIDGLVPATRYYVRVRARNSAGIGDWNEPISIIAR